MSIKTRQFKYKTPETRLDHGATRDCNHKARALV